MLTLNYYVFNSPVFDFPQITPSTLYSRITPKLPVTLVAKETDLEISFQLQLSGPSGQLQSTQ